MIKLNPFSFNQMMSQIKKEAETKRATRELNEVPEEIMAQIEMERARRSKLSPEIREKIRKGEPF
jgi:hypothetical protein